MNFRRFRYLPAVAGLIQALVLAGCSSVKDPVIAYQGEVPTDQIVRLKVQEGLQVLAVDDQRYKAPYVPDRGYGMHLKPGVHTISVYYSEIWGDATDATSMASDMFHFKLDLRPGQVYFVEHNAPANKMEPKDFPLEFSIWITDPTRSDKFAAVSTSPYASFVNRGIYGLGGGDASGGLPPKDKGSKPVSADSASVGGADAAGTSGAAATAGTAVAASSAAASGAASPVEGDGRNITILDELKAVWDDATEDDKSEFRKWIVDHP